MAFVRTHEISGMSYPFLTLRHTQGNLSPTLSPVTIRDNVFLSCWICPYSVYLVEYRKERVKRKTCHPKTMMIRQTNEELK